MKYYNLFSLSFLLVLLFGGPTLGQTNNKDADTQPLQYALSLYEKTIGDESHLYNGPQYINYDKYYIKGHQFYRTDEATSGKVFYDGSLYTPAHMLYDIVLDQIVLEHPGSEYLFSLVNEKVKYFTFQDHTFIRLEKDSLAGSPLKTGYYDLLHDGNVQLLAKRIKNMQEQPTPEGMEGYFDLIDRYYIRKDNVFYPVKDKRSVLKVFPDKKKELQRYIREHKLKFRKNREDALLQLARFYDNPKT